MKITMLIAQKEKQEDTTIPWCKKIAMITIGNKSNQHSSINTIYAFWNSKKIQNNVELEYDNK